jgi:hypothetical protein
MEKAGLGMNGWLARLAFQLPDGWVGVLLTPKVSVSCLGFATATSHLYLYLPPPTLTNLFIPLIPSTT